MIIAKMLLLLPLLVLIGFEATLFTNFPFAWRLGGCPSAGLGACYPTSYNWTNYAKDMGVPLHPTRLLNSNSQHRSTGKTLQ